MIRWKQSARNGLYGNTTFLGDMPDWNPAEIIGTFPKPLANSLYRYIIMDSAWRDARELMGYNSVRPNGLMVTLAGHPYVDIRCSFNSMIPDAIPDDLKEKLVNYYLSKLKKNPHLHDKVEFEILITSLNFEFLKQSDELRMSGFSDLEIDLLRQSLFQLTENLICDRNGLQALMEERTKHLEACRGKVRLIKKEQLPNGIKTLLDDLVHYGTIPFSVFARLAFVGSSFIRSLVNEKICTAEEYSLFLNSIDTVATEYLIDLERLQNGHITNEEIIEKYGHLRPGTYEVTAEAYRDNPQRYFATQLEHLETTKSFAFGPAVQEEITKRLKDMGFDFDCDTLMEFIRYNIAMREKVKFEFTKNLSLAIDLIKEFGLYYGISAEEIAFSRIEDIIRYASENITEHTISALKHVIDTNMQYHTWCARVILPDLIFGEADAGVVRYLSRQPNFITDKRICAFAVNLSELDHLLGNTALSEKIVLIESADPGYDWIFSKNIAGLITAYGGAASHMAIRCAELGIPAAIGCGAELFNSLKNAEQIELNCSEKRVTVVG